MNLQNFKTKVLEIAAEANELLTVISNQSHIAKLNDFLLSFNILVELVNDEKTLEVLIESENKADTDIQPLDNICKKYSGKAK